jgi:signal transduction histidine kinase/PAS domain-containing protein
MPLRNRLSSADSRLIAPAAPLTGALAGAPVGRVDDQMDVAEEARRLEALYSLGILHTPPDPAFDALTDVLRMLLDVPLAMIALIDRDHAWAKSISGHMMGPNYCPRDQALCNIVVRRKAMLVVEDAQSDPAHRNNPNVNGPRGFRFYVGVPLTTSSGEVIGAVCGFDPRARRKPEPARLKALHSLAASVVSTMEHRAAEAALRRKEAELGDKSRLLQTVLDSIEQGITAFDRDAKLVAWNRRAVELMNLPDDALAMGMSFEDFALKRAQTGAYGPGPIADVAAARVARFRTRELFCYDEVSPSGRVVALEARPLPDGGTMATHTDVTDERRSTEALRNEAARFQVEGRVAAIANEATSLDQAFGRILRNACDHSNYLWGRLYHFDGEHLVATQVSHDRVVELAEQMRAALPAITPAVEEAFRTGRGARAEITLPGTDIKAADFAFRLDILSEMYVIELFAEEGFEEKRWHPEARRNMEHQLSRVAQRERMSRMKSEFISTVSHELQTPITPLLGMLELLDSSVFGALPEEAGEAVGIAYENCRRLADTVEKIVNLEAIKSGKGGLSLRATAIAPVIEHAVGRFTETMPDRTIEIAAEPDAADAWALVDAARLSEILGKLLSNAVRFSTEPVRITTARHAEWLRVSVSDRGTGIPRSFQPRLFEPFAQADGSDTRQADGTGLGLAIVKQLVDLFGGQISVDTAPGAGTTFHLDLRPAEPA